MANFDSQLPYELMKQFEQLKANTPKMMEEMTRAGAETVKKNVKVNMKKAFKDTSNLEKNLKITKTYKTKRDGATNTKVGFYGYLPNSENRKLSYTRKNKLGRTKRYEYNNGIPAPLVAMAREFGTSHGEKKKPFFRKSFKPADINNSMEKVQNRYLPKE